jgi:hypothetical protein
MKKVILIFGLSIIFMPVTFAQKGTKNRSSETGQYVTKDYTKQNPRTTVTESGGNKSSSTKHRSAETGRYTTKNYSISNPKTTVTEHPKGGKKR